MDAVYRRQRHIYDFTRRYYLFGRDRLIASLALRPGDRLVEIGCGTARNLVRIARAYPGTTLFGIDASAEMLRSASRAIARAGLAHRITLVHGYAEALSPALFGETAPFDVALFSYSLSMILSWKQALDRAAAALSPAGRLAIVDFGDFDGMGALAKALMLGWLALFHVTPRRGLISAFSAEAGARASGRLSLLPGRYAFLLELPKTAFAAVGIPVAPESQEATKSP